MADLTMQQMLQVLTWGLTEQAELAASEVNCKTGFTQNSPGAAAEWANNAEVIARYIGQVAAGGVTQAQFADMLADSGIGEELAYTEPADLNGLPLKAQAWQICNNAGLLADY